ncbi:Kelch repeat and BTB domain-containing protein 13 [Oryzias melastigma]|uniref:Kelch repeat and BTB domain-containing protein 13 n=1 Tax=Oryzias melastigma TaxID=30732 RepID=A0A834BWJ4_ORYME|nr:Kelch repeat and BTB domain-containing protein 13 [Oryzias melastigma]
MERSSCSDLDHELGNDLKIIINDSVFNVAKTDLVKNCDFFRALFQSGMRECRQQAITLQSVGAPGFLVLLQVLHCERPMLSIDQITEAIQCTAFLQAPALTKHLISIINSENCLLMYDTSATYGVWELFHQSALFIRDMHADLKEDLLTLPRELVEYVDQYSSLFTAVIKGDSAFTLSRHATTEYAVDGCRSGRMCQSIRHLLPMRRYSLQRWDSEWPQ